MKLEYYFDALKCIWKIAMSTLKLGHSFAGCC